jgi:hypothetical protein
MRIKDVTINAFYTTRDGTLVRAVEKVDTRAGNGRRVPMVAVFEAEGQEPYRIEARELVARVAVLTYVDDCVPAKTKTRTFTTREEAEDYAENTLGSYFGPKVQW